MTFNPLKAVKRFLKVFVASGVGYGVCNALTDLNSNPWALIFTPVISGVIAAIGNTSKHKYGIKLPF